MAYLILKIAGQPDPVKLAIGQISLDYPRQGGAPSVTVQLSKEATDQLIGSLRTAKAGFGDGYGSWTTIDAMSAARIVDIHSVEKDGTERHVRFLPHEREKVLTAMTKAFDAVCG